MLFGVSRYGDFCYNIKPVFYDEVRGIDLYYQEGEGLNNYVSHCFSDADYNIFYLDQ